ncbi:MucR family transcriptional regulator [Rhizobium leguminosarum]|uniref:MucR family transcriptional regulator n=1 Tax=Rhizobium leguminosarum TaxID=384 RepID=UPI0014415398|nr:MucR family transcriptional regulator [Rhizobium leguminosarum]
MISIDVNSLNDRDQIADAIAKLTNVLTALEAVEKTRAKARELYLRDDIAEYARKIMAGNTHGIGLAPHHAKIVDRFSDLTHEDLDELNAGFSIRIEPHAPPFMDPQEAIQDDGIFCLIDGAKRKFLARYVRQVHGLGWQEYLRRFGLPDDYPRTSKDVIAQRSKAATERGFGKHDRVPEIEEQVQVTVPVRRTFGRRSVPQQVIVKVDIGGSVNTTAGRRKERRLGGLL